MSSISKPTSRVVCTTTHVLCKYGVSYSCDRGHYRLMEHGLTMSSTPYTRLICSSKHLKLIRKMAAGMIRAYRNRPIQDDIYDHVALYRQA